jgi:hypothetical protein
MQHRVGQVVDGVFDAGGGAHRGGAKGHADLFCEQCPREAILHGARVRGGRLFARGEEAEGQDCGAGLCDSQ